MVHTSKGISPSSIEHLIRDNLFFFLVFLTGIHWPYHEEEWVFGTGMACRSRSILVICEELEH